MFQNVQIGPNEHWRVLLKEENDPTHRCSICRLFDLDLNLEFFNLFWISRFSRLEFSIFRDSEINIYYNKPHNFSTFSWKKELSTSFFCDRYQEHWKKSEYFFHINVKISCTWIKVNKPSSIVPILCHFRGKVRLKWPVFPDLEISKFSKIASSNLKIFEIQIFEIFGKAMLSQDLSGACVSRTSMMT